MSQPTPPKKLIQRALNDIALKPIYPPFDEGVPMMELEELVWSQAKTIKKIRVAFSMTDAEFENIVLSTIRNYVAYVHLLPATKQEFHIGTGGLYKLGLDIAFYATQAAEGKVYSSKETAERRRMLHPKWVYATFVAGLCAELNLPITTMTVTSKKGNVWPATDSPLYQWAQEEQTDSYFIHWREQPVISDDAMRANSSYVLSMIISKEGKDYLRTENNIVFSQMVASVAGNSRHGDGNVIAETVRHYRDWVIEKDIKANPSYYGKLTVGAHLASTVIDIMRELYSSNDWTVNSKGSRIWNTKEGCFIVWGAAFAEITAAMQKRKVTGAPTSSETMAELMLDSDMIEPQLNGSPTWEVTLPNSPQLKEAVKLIDPAIIFQNAHLPVSNHSLLNPFTPPEEGNPITTKAEVASAVSEPKAVVSEQKTEAPGPTSKVNQPAPAESQQAQKKEITTEPVKKNTDNGQTKNKNTEQTLNKQQEANKTQQNASQNSRQHKPEVKTDETKPDASSANSKILEQVSEQTARLLSAIKDDYLAGKSEHPVWMNAKGLVISRQEFESHGMDAIKVLDELTNYNWIVRDAENNNRVIYKTEKDGVKISGYVLNKSIALAFGFKEKNA